MIYVPIYTVKIGSIHYHDGMGFIRSGIYLIFFCGDVLCVVKALHPQSRHQEQCQHRTDYDSGCL